MKTWTIFGVGTIIADVIDAVYSNGDIVKAIYFIEEDFSKHKHLDKIYRKEIELKNMADFFPTSDCCCFGLADHQLKQDFVSILNKYQLNFENLIHSKAYIAESAKLGKGNAFGPGCVIAANAVIGNYNYFNRLTSVGHDTHVGDYNFFALKSSLGGVNACGSFNFFGAGSTTINNIKVVDNVVLGAGAVAVNDLAKSGTYLGLPAKLHSKKSSVSVDLLS